MGPKTQTAVIHSSASASGLPLTVSNSSPVPNIPSPHHVLVRVLAVALNPTDYKMATYYLAPNNATGCDFCGIVELAGASAALAVGTRVCSSVFPYGSHNLDNGAFAQWVVADARHMLSIPDSWSDTQAAALGAIGWMTAAMALWDPEALGLTGLPSQPVEKPVPVLVYGGATATGLMAIQMLKLSGYTPIAVCSPTSAPLVMRYGAIGTASYSSANCVATIRSVVDGMTIRHALDCITDVESASICFGAIGRTGGRYACIEACPESWVTRRAVKVKEVMSFEVQEGIDVDLGPDSVYTRKSNPELHKLAMVWTKEMQMLLDVGKITTKPVMQLEGGFQGVVNGLHTLQAGENQGHKLVARIS